MLVKYYTLGSKYRRWGCKSNWLDLYMMSECGRNLGTMGFVYDEFLVEYLNVLFS